MINNGASRSIHDLRSINLLKQPPSYPTDTTFRVIQQHAYPQQLYPQNPHMAQAPPQGRQHRWHTHVGNDELAAFVTRMRYEQELADQHYMVQQQQYPVYQSHLSKSVPVLDQQVELGKIGV